LAESLKTFYFTPIASPFQLDFIASCNEKLSGSEIIPIFINPLPIHRQHWGENNLGIDLYLLKGSRITRTWRLLETENPHSCFLSSYTNLENWVARFWCLTRSKSFFIGPVEPMNTHTSGIVRHAVRLHLFKKFAKRASGLAAMGNNALRAYRKVFSGKMINISYTFDHKDLLNTAPFALEKPITFLYSGRLSSFRNPLLVIKAFSQVREIHHKTPMNLIISGRGDLYEDCISLIKAKDLENEVIWINDFKDWKDIHSIYSKAHVLLALQHYSTWGIIIQEAMAAGMGIIASRTIEAADNLIIDGYNGYLISVDEQEAVEAMSRYIMNKHLITDHGTRSRDIVINYDVESQSKKFVNHFFK
tara:strand:+ start:1367 stop:2449 length:1083 start_codon:yes stop_codon:yes gene_type:complete